MTAFAQAMTHYDRGELRQAIPFFQRALVEEPENVNVLYRTMLALVAMRDYSGCAKYLQELLPHINPAETPSWMMGGFHYNLAIAYEASGEWAKAERAHRNALTYDPTAILPKICIGSNCYRQGNHDEGKQWHDQALEPDVIDVESRPARSFLKLLRGDYLGGFREYEARWKLPQVLAHSYVPKDAWRWKGKPLDGKKILVVGEQGIGDTILMARYIPLIEERGGKVVLMVNPTLHRLFAHNFPNVQIVPHGEKHPFCQWWVPMMSLPYVFGTTKDTIPATHFANIFSPDVGVIRSDAILRVGYASGGNPLFMGNKDRSAPVDAFATLFDVAGIDFVDLSENADRERGAKDMADTAALISQLDLVITVDTAIGHLAGALGGRTWLLPMTSLHWLWGMPDELTSPWYPNHTLYRRTSVNAWSEVIDRVKADLIQLVKT